MDGQDSRESVSGVPPEGDQDACGGTERLESPSLGGDAERLSGVDPPLRDGPVLLGTYTARVGKLIYRRSV